jgi:hypothetical protein
MVSEVENAIIELSYTFEERYGHLWVGSNDDLERTYLKNKLKAWHNEILKGNFTEREISGAVKLSLNQHENKLYPPNLNTFIGYLKEFRLMFSNGEFSSTYKEMKKLDEIFQFTYNGLWTDADANKNRRRLEFWSKEFIDYKIPPELIIQVGNKIRKKNEYRVYPPTLNQFIFECQFLKNGYELNDPEKMFNLAIQGEFDDLDSIAEKVVSVIGTRAIKLTFNSSMKRQFIDMYYQAASEFIDNPDKFLKAVNTNKSDVNEDEIQPESCTSFFDKLRLKSTKVR